MTTDAWIITDARGRIQTISSGAHEVLGLPRLGLAERDERLLCA